MKKLLYIPAFCCALLTACGTPSSSMQAPKDHNACVEPRPPYLPIDWDKLTHNIKEQMPKHIGIEVNRVYNGSLRILIPEQLLFSHLHTNTSHTPDNISSSKHILSKQTESVLLSIAKEIKDAPSLRIQVVGHHANSHNAQDTQIDSLRHAYVIAKKLIALNINSSRITLEGRGAMDPMIGIDKPSARLFNNRIELYLYQSN